MRLRCIIPPIKNDHVSIGRVISSQAVRGQGVGKQVMLQSMSFVKQHKFTAPIKISAQHHLMSFYEEFGFVKYSKPYDEDGILHIDMMLNQDNQAYT